MNFSPCLVSFGTSTTFPLGHESSHHLQSGGISANLVLVTIKSETAVPLEYLKIQEPSILVFCPDVFKIEVYLIGIIVIILSFHFQWILFLPSSLLFVVLQSLEISIVRSTSSIVHCTSTSGTSFINSSSKLGRINSTSSEAIRVPL